MQNYKRYQRNKNLFAWCLVLLSYCNAHLSCEGIYKLSVKENKITADLHLTISTRKLGSGLEFDVTYNFNDFPITEDDIPQHRLIDKEFYFGDRNARDNYIHLFYEVDFGQNLPNVGNIFIRYATETVLICENRGDLDSGKVSAKVTESFRRELANSNHHASNIDEPQTVLNCKIRDYLVNRYCVIKNVSLGNQSNVIIEIDTPVDAPADRVDILEIFGNVSTLTKVFCETFPHLMGFEASRLSLQSIDEDAFHKCTKLKQLNLISNKLTYISPLVFERSNKLQVLNLQHNPLQSVLESSYFKFLPNLQRLSLEGNELYSRDFDITDFPVMKDLQYLDLRGFRSDDMWSNFPKPIVVDTEMILKKLPNLEQLDLVEKDELKSDELNRLQEFFNNHSVKCCRSNSHFGGGI